MLPVFLIQRLECYAEGKLFSTTERCKEKKTWSCKRGVVHESECCLYWVFDKEEWENVEYQYGQTGKLGVQIMAMHECGKKMQKLFQTMSLSDLLDALKEIDRLILCVRLPRQLGRRVIQLGIELGLSFASIEETIYNNPKNMYNQLYDVLKKWKESSEQKPSVNTLMKALQRTDSGGLTFLRNEYKPT
ncbi:unnamed protein product [Mytilus edulis]|uniref:Death domain-containing protein n=1 Tax=Mytilus edulis TaxID=6550 RepID=A0A8S3VE12_MYTED|nr:unnamed protein product [Mytilus edulis]